METSTAEAPTPVPTFLRELESLINRHSMENGSDTPDFILADYLNHCLAIFNGTLKAREKWYGRKCGDGQAILTNSKPVSG